MRNRQSSGSVSRVAVVAVPDYEPWIIARWGFELLMGRLLEVCIASEDAAVIERARALNGLHFDLLEADQRTRLSALLAAVSDELRFDIESGRTEVPDREGFALALAELEMRLHDLYESDSRTAAED